LEAEPEALPEEFIPLEEEDEEVLPPEEPVTEPAEPELEELGPEELEPEELEEPLALEEEPEELSELEPEGEPETEPEEPETEEVVEAETDAEPEEPLELEEEPEELSEVEPEGETIESETEGEEPEVAELQGPKPLPPQKAQAPGATKPEKDQKKAATGMDRERVLNLFQYLKDLTSNLPEEQRNAFKKSDARLRMEYVIDRLEGRKGLFKEVRERIGRGQEESTPSLAKSPDIAKTLAYLGNLAKALPDRDLTQAIERKVQKVVKDIAHGGKGD
jgi:hypothetical protein